jgi:phenylpropionate dioxygenase-like ring-hydroxylating dioxygenase large terminal subunit
MDRTDRPGRGPAPLGTSAAEPADGLGNTDPCLDHGWHPVALLDALQATGGENVDVVLLGRTWTLRLVDGAVSAEPEPAGVTVANGVVWLAPSAPLAPVLAVPEYDDDGWVHVWLDASSTSACAGLLADNFLDLAHFPFVHAGTFGSEAALEVPRYTVTPDGLAFRYSFTHAFNNPEDPGVARGVRPLLQTRTVTYDFVPPFQLLLRIEPLEAGGASLIHYLLRPGGETSTTAYTCVLRERTGGAPVDLQGMAAYEQAVLDEDLALQGDFSVTALPLDLRTELHVRSDAAGVALRRALTDFRAAAAAARADVGVSV